LVVAGLSASLVANCGGSTPQPAPPDTTAESVTEATPSESASAAPAEAESSSAPEAWSDDLSPEQKGAFMAERVMPAMRPVFAQAPDFTCKTCHGPDQVDNKAFAHPNQHLPRLEFKDGKMTSFETKPEVSKFMAEKVLPAMAQVMGKEPYSQDNPTGFGCNGCHAVDM
jgi:hypothetical protein